MPFVSFWDSTVTIDNRAMNGRYDILDFLRQNKVNITGHLYYEKG